MVSIPKEQLEKLLIAQHAYNDALMDLVQNLRQPAMKSADIQAVSRAYGIPERRVRYLIQKGVVSAVKISARRTEVNLEDMEKVARGDRIH